MSTKMIQIRKMIGNMFKEKKEDIGNNPLTNRNVIKRKYDDTKRQQIFLLLNGLHNITDLGISVGVTEATQLVKFTRFHKTKPPHSPQGARNK